MNMWRRINAEDVPITHHTYLTQHEEDLHPVAAYLMDDGVWRRAIEGPEDDPNPMPGSNYPLYRAPTHFQELPDSPLVQEEKAARR